MNTAMNIPTLKDKEQDTAVYDYIYTKLLACALQSGAKMHKFDEDGLVFEKGHYVVSIDREKARLTSVFEKELKDPTIKRRNGIIENTIWQKISTNTLIFPDYITNEDQADELLYLVCNHFIPNRYGNDDEHSV